MRLKLKEDPREWRRFALTGCAVAGGLVCLLLWRGRIKPDAFFWIVGALVLIGGSAVLRAQWFRLPYRVAMTVSFRIGQVVGRTRFCPSEAASKSGRWDQV